MSSSTFITQPKINLDDYPTDEIGELEALVSGVTQTSQSTLLLKKRKEMREVDDALEFMKEEFASRMRACEERQREFERRQNEMKEQVTKFEKFIQENDAKRQRAEMKARAEHWSRTFRTKITVQRLAQIYKTYRVRHHKQQH